MPSTRSQQLWAMLNQNVAATQTNLDASIEEYIELNDELDLLQKRMTQIKSNIMIALKMSGESKHECNAGKAIIVGESERTTYPKGDLDSIAKNDKKLRAILDSVAKKTIVSEYVRIS